MPIEIAWMSPPAGANKGSAQVMAAAVMASLPLIALAVLVQRKIVGRLHTVTSPLFETATTLDLCGSLVVAVNAQFLGSPIDPEPEVVLLRPT